MSLSPLLDPSLSLHRQQRTWLAHLDGARHEEADDSWPDESRSAPWSLLVLPPGPSGLWGRVRCVDLVNELFDDARIEKMADAGCFAHLTHATLGQTQLSSRGLNAFLHGAPVLRALDLRLAQWDQMDWGALQRLPTHLRLHRPSGEALGALLQCPGSRDLESLAVDGTRSCVKVDVQACSALRLRHLALRGCVIDRQVARALLPEANNAFTTLRLVDSSGEALVERACALGCDLQALALQATSLPRSLWEQLIVSGVLRHTGTLSLAYSNFASTALAALGEAAPELSHLDLSGLQMSALDGCVLPEKLRALEVCSAGWTDAHMQQWLKEERALPLEEVDLSDNPDLTDVGMLLLVERARGLRRLNLTNTSVSQRTLVAFGRQDSVLEHMSLSQIRFGPLRLLADIRFSHLHTLDLEDTHLVFEPPSSLWNRRCLPLIRDLNLTGGGLLQPQASFLEFCRESELRELELAHTDGSTSARAMEASATTLTRAVWGGWLGLEELLIDAINRTAFPALSELDLSEARFTSDQLAGLEPTHLPVLERLSIGITNINALLTLAQHPLLGQLRFLVVVVGDYEGTEPTLALELLESGEAKPGLSVSLG